MKRTIALGGWILAAVMGAGMGVLLAGLFDADRYYTTHWHAADAEADALQASITNDARFNDLDFGGAYETFYPPVLLSTIGIPSVREISISISGSLPSTNALLDLKRRIEAQSPSYIVYCYVTIN